MTQTEPERRVGALGNEARFCLCESYARVTERAALAGARWLGRADQAAAEEDASTAMRIAIEQLPIDGRIVIGAGGEDSQLAPDARIGSGGVEVDLALAVEADLAATDRQSISFERLDELAHNALGDEAGPGAMRRLRL